MPQKKNSYIANFNCTFGENDEPMLPYFEDVIYPALSKDFGRTDKQWLIFENVKLMFVDGVYVLSGLIIKRTELEVMTRYVDGELVRTNKVYPSDPFSFFMINLKNHRMVLTQNQKGSPTLSNFQRQANRTIRKYIKHHNDLSDEKYPIHHLRVVAIPFKNTIENELKKVKKIRNVILRFYPLNGDIIDNETSKHLHDALEKLGSNTGNITYNTPDNKENVAKVIEDTKGLMQPTIRAEYQDGSVKTIRDGSFSEVIKIPVNDNNTIEENIENISKTVINRNEFVETSDENLTLYNRFVSKLESIYRSLL